MKVNNKYVNIFNYAKVPVFLLMTISNHVNFEKLLHFLLIQKIRI